MNAVVLAATLSLAAAEAPERPTRVETPALAPLGHGGIGLLASGAVACGVGGALFGVGRSRPRFDQSKYRDLRPAGITLFALGGAAAVSGLALLITDRALARRTRRFAVHPRFGPSGAGLSIRGRF